MQEAACKARDSGSIPGLGRPSGGGNGNPLQYSCLGNPVDRGAWRATLHGVHDLATKPPPLLIESLWALHGMVSKPSSSLQIATLFPTLHSKHPKIKEFNQLGYRVCIQIAMEYVKSFGSTPLINSEVFVNYISIKLGGEKTAMGHFLPPPLCVALCHLSP